MADLLALPELAPIAAVPASVADALLDELYLEIAMLERELADLDAAVDQAEEHAARVALAPGLTAAALDFGERAVRELVASGREEIRRDVEEPGYRSVVETLLGMAGTLDLHPPARIDEAAPAAVPRTAVALVATADGEAAPADTSAELARVDELEAEIAAGVRAAATSGPTTGEDATFDAFWREQADAEETRGLARASVDALVPMGFLLLILTVVLHFI